MLTLARGEREEGRRQEREAESGTTLFLPFLPCCCSLLGSLVADPQEQGGFLLLHLHFISGRNAMDSLSLTSNGWKREGKEAREGNRKQHHTLSTLLLLLSWLLGGCLPRGSITGRPVQENGRLSGPPHPCTEVWQKWYQNASLDELRTAVLVVGVGQDFFL